LLREVEKELGVGTGCISHWRKELQDQGELSFPGNGKLNEKDAEMARLKRELEIVKQERDILKKAVGIFSNHSK
jgi:transposase